MKIKRLQQLSDEILSQLQTQNLNASIRPIGNWNTHRLISIDLPGKNLKSVTLKKKLGEFIIYIDSFECIGIEYDDEFLSIEKWSIIDGVLLIVLEYSIPEKYTKIENVNYNTAHEMFDSYGYNLIDRGFGT